ncbi:MAG: hypothetical protein K1X89_24405 [Myxococcaceae bacterium]|nr:hypothetical protein [Myxococcaceae bacterium]
MKGAGPLLALALTAAACDGVTSELAAEPREGEGGAGGSALPALARDAGLEGPDGADAGALEPRDAGFVADASVDLPPVLDAGHADAGARDAGAVDAGAVDAGRPDAGSLPTGPRCLVLLHGRSGTGAPTQTVSGYRVVMPDGNQAYGGGGLVWIYFPASEYAAMAAGVRAAIPADCGRIVLRGFSNGASAAAKLFCRGETFGGRLLGVIVDDPVMDDGTQGCAPGAKVPVEVYATGALPAGPYQCSSNGFTCEGGEVVSASTYVSRLGSTASLHASDQSAHACYGGTCTGLPPQATGWW